MLRITRCILALLVAFQPLAAQHYSIEHQGEQRNYLLHLPKGFNRGKTYPLVLNFHGGGGNPEQQRMYTLMDNVADKEGFIVVYPETCQMWEVGLFPRKDAKGTDDLDFVRRLLDTLSLKFPVDKNRIYAAGLSMGGFFANRLACELNGRIAAFASVSGPISDKTRDDCKTTGKAPFLYFHGTSDPIVSYIGSKEFASAKSTVEFWRDYNQCQTSDTVEFPNRNKDLTTSKLVKFHCRNDSQVWFVKITNGGHTWPGGSINYWYFGTTSSDFNASELIWNFFKQFSLKKGSSKLSSAHN